MRLGDFSVLVLTFTLVAFGNGPAMFPLLEKSLVEEHQVLTVDQTLYAFAISQVTPGQANLFVVSLGYLIHGLVGALLATVVLVLPAYVILPLMGGYDRLKNFQAVGRFTRGMTSSSVGLILAATVEIGRTSLVHPSCWVAFLVTLGLSRLGRWRPLPSLLTASGAGMLMLTLWKL